MTGNELHYIAEAHRNKCLAGDGAFTRKCQNWIESQLECNKVLLTHSCTAALEMAALLLDIKPGDEIIMPSYTFVSTANAFVLRGGIPVFVDIRRDTLNLDENLIEAAITSRTRAIVPVHYAGVSCEMDSIMALAKSYNLTVIEDAAQGVMSKYKGKSLGTIGDLGTYSFHETKNIISGEGGALVVNNSNLELKSEIIWEKGTDRSQFFRGEVDKYTWKDIGSSFLPGEVTSAFLWAQLENADQITRWRLELWKIYHELLKPLESIGVIRCPTIPSNCEHNGHIYYVVLQSKINRQQVLEELKKKKVSSVFHYVPLHSSPGGTRYGRTSGSMEITNRISTKLIRLPLWIGLTKDEQYSVVDALTKAILMQTCTYKA
jgi:dTDP-4-amino-4,6-dideoxygalactose transaminase